MKIRMILGCMYNALKLIFHLTYLSIKALSRASQTANIKLQYSKEYCGHFDFLNARSEGSGANVCPQAPLFGVVVC